MLYKNVRQTIWTVWVGSWFKCHRIEKGFSYFINRTNDLVYCPSLFGVLLQWTLFCGDMYLGIVFWEIYRSSAEFESAGEWWHTCILKRLFKSKFSKPLFVNFGSFKNFNRHNARVTSTSVMNSNRKYDRYNFPRTNSHNNFYSLTATVVYSIE